MTLILAALLAAASAWLVMRPARRSSRSTSLAHPVADRIRRRLATHRQAPRWRAATREALAEIVADLRAGQPVTRAAERAFATDSGEIAPRTLASIRWGGDVVAALREDSRAIGRPLLAGAAACWSVAEASGAGLADALDRIVQQDRKAEEVRRQLGAHLAAPRATARMLAVLPLLGIALGFAIGGDPLGWLLGTPLGWGCLAVGVGLTAIGLAWTSHIATRTERLL